jgi:hypothetical protein
LLGASSADDSSASSAAGRLDAEVSTDVDSAWRAARAAISSCSLCCRLLSRGGMVVKFVKFSCGACKSVLVAAAENKIALDGWLTA